MTSFHAVHFVSLAFFFAPHYSFILPRVSKKKKKMFVQFRHLWLALELNLHMESPFAWKEACCATDCSLSFLCTVLRCFIFVYFTLWFTWWLPVDLHGICFCHRAGKFVPQFGILRWRNIPSCGQNLACSCAYFASLCSVQHCVSSLYRDLVDHHSTLIFFHHFSILSFSPC